MPLPYEPFEKWFYYAHERLGADSEFDAENGVYIDMMRASMLRLPRGWEKRALERILLAETPEAIVVVYPELHDLLASKLFAGRAQDLEFLQGARQLLSVDRKTLKRRINQIDLSREQERQRAHALRSLDSAFEAH